MRYVGIICLVAMAQYLSSCYVANVHPLWTPSDPVTVAALEGEWTNVDGDTWFGFHNPPEGEDGPIECVFTVEGSEDPPTRLAVRPVVIRD